MATGRPRFELTEQDIRKIEMMAGWGLTLAQICAVLGVSESVMCERQRTEARVSAALEAGRAKAQAKVGKSLFERAVDGDVAAIRWYEMTRAKRSAAVAVEQHSVAEVTVAPSPDWRALIGQPPTPAADDAA